MFEATSNSDKSETAFHFLLIEWKQRGLDRERYQDPNRDRYNSDEIVTIVNRAAEEYALIAAVKRFWNKTRHL